jgi:membrane-bound lytic murein transglycosylase MltF
MDKQKINVILRIILAVAIASALFLYVKTQNEKIDALGLELTTLQLQVITSNQEHEIAWQVVSKEQNLLDGKIDTLEQIIDRDKRRKTLINKVVYAIKQVASTSPACPDSMDSGEVVRVAGSVVDLGERYAVPAALILGVIKQESNFCQAAKSPVGAQGYMQLMPDTAAEVSNAVGMALNPWTTRDNIHLGTAYLSRLLTIFEGDIDLTAKAYNAGPNHVRKVVAGITKEYHAESLDYSVKVLEYTHTFQKLGVTW